MGYDSWGRTTLGDYAQVWLASTIGPNRTQSPRASVCLWVTKLRLGAA